MADLTAVLSSMAASVVWAFLGVVLLLVAFRLFDAVNAVDYIGEIKKGNVAAGVVIGGVMIGMAIIIHAAIA